MNPLFTAIVGSMVRAALVAVGAAMVTRGAIAQSDAEQLAGYAPIVAATAWSIAQKVNWHALLGAALKLPKNSTVADAKWLVQQQKAKG